MPQVGITKIPPDGFVRLRPEGLASHAFHEGCRAAFVWRRKRLRA